MNGTKICPICHEKNNPQAEKCSSCGQRFKALQLKDKKYKNYFKKHSLKTTSKKSWIGGIFFIFLLVILSISIFNEQTISVISKIIPQKIINVNNMTTFINQSEKFDLPSQIGAKMNYGRDKAVIVNWQTKKVDSSTVGTKLINGKINGYDKVVCFKIIVLPNQVEQSLGNYIVQNSMVELNVKLSKTIKWVWFKISKGNELKDETVPITNGAMNCKLYLPFGSGDYKVIARTSTSENENSSYYELKNISIKNQDIRDMRFLMPNIYIQNDSEVIRNLAYKITESCVSDIEKTRAIHDWVCSNIAYDVEALNNTKVHNYSAIETYLGNKAVCNGYANLAAALNRAIGIRCKIITGTAKNSIFDAFSKDNSHAWNETYIDGKWIIQDTTWDAGTVDPLTKKFEFALSHKYFNPTSSSFVSTHTKTSEE